MNSQAFLLFFIVTTSAIFPGRLAGQQLASSRPRDFYLNLAPNELPPQFEYFLEGGQFRNQLPVAELELPGSENSNFYYIPEGSSPQIKDNIPVEYSSQVEPFDERQGRILELVNRLEDLESAEQQQSETNNKIISYISEPINELREYKLRQANLTRSTRTQPGEELEDKILSAYVSSVLKKLAASDKPQFAEQQQLFSAEPPEEEPEVEEREDQPASRYGTGEYIDHPLALAGHQYVQGGAGEGRQLLGPEGTFENVQVVKTDHGVPSYCNPPNPCPIGYTAEDGCLEKFVNSASFSREYQAKQKCSCDNEHSLFNCAAAPIGNTGSDQLIEPGNEKPASGKQPTTEPLNSLDGGGDGESHEGGAGRQEEHTNKLIVLARTIENRFGNLASVRNLINSAQNEDD